MFSYFPQNRTQQPFFLLAAHGQKSGAVYNLRHHDDKPSLPFPFRGPIKTKAERHSAPPLRLLGSN
jgi:hypothetical protein